MLKKAGLTIAVAAAGMLAVSPLAFAGDYQWGGQGHGQGGHGHSVVKDNTNGDTSSGLVNVSGNNVNVPIQACNNDVPVQVGILQGQVPINNVTAALSGALALFGNSSSSVTQVTDNSRSCGDNSGSAGDANLQKNG